MHQYNNCKSLKFNNFSEIVKIYQSINSNYISFAIAKNNDKIDDRKSLHQIKGCDAKSTIFLLKA